MYSGFIITYFPFCVYRQEEEAALRGDGRGRGHAAGGIPRAARGERTTGTAPILPIEATCALIVICVTWQAKISEHKVEGKSESETMKEFKTRIRNETRKVHPTLCHVIAPIDAASVFIYTSSGAARRAEGPYRHRTKEEIVSPLCDGFN